MSYLFIKMELVQISAHSVKKYCFIGYEGVCVCIPMIYIVTADILDDWLSDTILKVDRIIQANIS